MKIVVNQPTPPPPPPATYDIVGLTREDMQALIDVCGSTSGKVQEIRTTTDKLYYAIRAEGFTYRHAFTGDAKAAR